MSTPPPTIAMSGAIAAAIIASVFAARSRARRPMKPRRACGEGQAHCVTLSRDTPARDGFP